MVLLGICLVYVDLRLNLVKNGFYSEEGCSSLSVSAALILPWPQPVCFLFHGSARNDSYT